MTRIEWADETVNPVVGCAKISPACEHCYAERFAARGLTPAHAAATRGGRWTGELVWQPGQLEKLARWRSPRRVFLGSMTDLGRCDPRSFALIWDAMENAHHHTYMLLTKRPRELGELIRGVGDEEVPPWLWVGATAWDQPSADAMARKLLGVPAALHFMSFEPLLGPVDLSRWPRPRWGEPVDRGPGVGVTRPLESECIDFVIVGGETGPGARPMHPDWPRRLRDDAVAAGTPFFFKSWGATAAGRKLDGEMWDEVPEQSMCSEDATLCSTRLRAAGDAPASCASRRSRAMPER